jgi:hypothetical protein
MTMNDPAALFRPGPDIVCIGELSVPSGRLIACDPFRCKTASAFARTIPPGLYAVELRLTDAGDLGVRVAAARLVINSARPPRSMEPAELEDSPADRYVVDAGLGCFMDEEARDALVAAMDQHRERDPGGNYYTDVLAADFSAGAAATPGAGHAGLWAMHHVAPASLSIAVFSSGLGDGGYRSYWALAAPDDPAFLYTDFEIANS